MKIVMKLMISENEWLEFNEYNDDPEHPGCLCCMAQLVYRNKRKKIILVQSHRLHDFEDTFEESLKNVVEHQKELHPSLQNNIGYWHNEYQKSEDPEKDSRFIVEKGQPSYNWVGHDYLVFTSWGTKPHSALWLYNDKNGDVILEITPVYSWFFKAPRKNEKLITYEEFIKNYKTTLIRVIPKKVASEWLKQTHAWLQQYQDNICYG